MGMFSPHATRVEAGHLELMETLVNYHDSGGYGRDLQQVGKQAFDYLDSLPQTQGKPAMVLDIDETSLANNWSSMVKPGREYDVEAWDQWINAAKAPPIQPTLDLFNAAKARQIEVFFITGRHPNERDVTETNLRRAGYEGWTELIMEPRQANHPALLVFPEAAAYKSAARWGIEERGYDILINVGDQLSDLSGGFAEKTFKLPNPFYTII